MHYIKFDKLNSDDYGDDDVSSIGVCEALGLHAENSYSYAVICFAPCGVVGDPFVEGWVTAVFLD